MEKPKIKSLIDLLKSGSEEPLSSSRVAIAVVILDFPRRHLSRRHHRHHHDAVAQTMIMMSKTMATATMMMIIFVFCHHIFLLSLVADASNWDAPSCIEEDKLQLRVHLHE